MILTDSGGFQVMSLAELRKLEDDGVVFKSHIDGSSHKLTPAKVIEIQAALGSDCWTTLDECPPYPATEAQALSALERTMRWTDASVPVVNNLRSTHLFFPILQGSFYTHLRKRAAEHLAGIPHDGVSMGGFSVGEPKELTWKTLDETTSFLQPGKARYLMGVGTPEDLWEAVRHGVDMMDCVWPTRVARNGQVMTRTGKFNITNAASRGDFGPLDPACACFVCKKYSRSYLRHLFQAHELLVFRLISYHNLFLMEALMSEIRQAIVDERFEEKRKAFLDGRVTKKP
jgi:queuine tRNA-ribosyltransferase